VAKPRPISVIDFETDPFDGTTDILPFVAGYYDGHTFKHFWSDECAYELADFLAPRRELCYAHNGGKFDFYYLLPWANRDLITVINGRISQMSIGRCLFRDSYMLYPLALSNYRKDEIDYAKMKRDVRENHKDEIISYLKIDCESLYEVVTGFIEKFGRQTTMSMASMKQLKKTLPNDIVRLNKDQDANFRPFYFGGRCQAFKYGEFTDKYKIYDINSAYPRAMMEHHPNPCDPNFKMVSEIPKNTSVYFAEIEAVSRGCLPWRDESDHNKLKFPNDSLVRRYYATGYEIQAGLDTHTLDIKRVISVYIPRSTINFSEFIGEHWEARFKAKKEGDKLNEDYEKLIMNSSYGKWALNPNDYKSYRISDVGVDPNKTDESVKECGYWILESSWPNFGIDVYSRPDPDDTGFYNVTVSASITGWVRAYLWRTICQCSGVIYCDTDSITCKEFNGDIGNGLGQWKFEHTVGPCYIAGKKLYAFYYGQKKGKAIFDDVDDTGKYRWKIASKGVRLLPLHIAEIARDDSVVVWFSDSPTFSLKFGQRVLQRDVKQTR
jgi:hypothetical protein